MLFIISAVGFVGALILGLDGLRPGSAGQPELIAATACFALAAAGIVGILADDGARTPRNFRHPNVLHVIAVAPIMALSLGVFLMTLVPALYVSLPFFAIWYLASGAPGRRAEPVPARGRDREHPLQTPAYP